MYAATIRAADRWNGLQISELEREQLRRLQKQQLEDHRRTNAPVVDTSSTADRFYSKTGT
jgi:hypothetical protein